MRAFQRDDRAFSVVVGAIVLIAITISIATAIWIMVDRVRHDTNLDEERPELGMKVDENEPVATVVRASSELDYVRDLHFSGTCAPTLNGGPLPSSEGRLVTANDRLECAWGESLVISSSSEKGNAVLFKHTF